MNFKRQMDDEYDERRDPNRQIFRELHVAMDRLESGMEKLSPLLGSVAVLETRVETMEREIERLRDAQKPDETTRGGTTKFGVTLGMAIVSILVTVVLKLIDWIIAASHR